MQARAAIAHRWVPDLLVTLMHSACIIVVQAEYLVLVLYLFCHRVTVNVERGTVYRTFHKLTTVSILKLRTGLRRFENDRTNGINKLAQAGTSTP